MTGCLDDNDASEFVSGSLPGEAATRVERHLAGCRDCRSLIAALAGGADEADADSDVVTAPRRAALGKRGKAVALAVASTQIGSDPPTDPATPRPRRRDPVVAAGDSIGRYVILARLGAGGMGVVYTAYDPQLDRKIALKLLRTGTGVGDAEARARLIREAQAIAQLSHPNVVAVHDVGAADSGEVYIAMELVEGETLTSWLGHWDRSWREILDLFFQAGRGLAAAHARGLVHRDFKPDNVLVGADGRVRVTDFGLARSLIEQVDELVRDTPGPDLAALRVTLTATGTVLGTPRYMAPEQLRGADADARSDQFSFCVALYEALYGRHPLPGDSVLEAAQHGATARPPPGEARVPAAIGRAIMRGLSPEPGKRFPSLTALLDELTPPARSPGRRGWQVALAAAALAAGGAAAAMVGTMRDEHSLAMPALRTELETARREKAELTARIDEIVRGPGGLADKQRELEALEREIARRADHIEKLEQKIAEVEPPARPPPKRPPPPPPELPPHVQPGLTDVTLASSLLDRHGGFESCFLEWMERNPGHGASLLVSFAVQPDGSARVERVRGMDDAVAPSCVAGVVGRTRFPASSAVTRAEVAIVLEGGAIRVTPRRLGAERPGQVIDLGGG